MASTQPSGGFYSYVLNENHHRDAWRLFVLICVVVIIALLVWAFYSPDDLPKENITPVVDEYAARQALLMSSDQRQMSSAEFNSRHTLLDNRTPSTRPSVEEVERRMRLLETP